MAGVPHPAEADVHSPPPASGVPAVVGVLAVSQYGPLSVITIRIPVTDNQNKFLFLLLDYCGGGIYDTTKQ